MTAEHDAQALFIALEFTVEEMGSMVAYVPDFFREKWLMDDTIRNLRQIVGQYSEYRPVKK